jgi:hypothetical protein
MLTQMTDDEWTLVLDIFRTMYSRRDDKGRNDRGFLEALHWHRQVERHRDWWKPV